MIVLVIILVYVKLSYPVVPDPVAAELVAPDPVASYLVAEVDAITGSLDMTLLAFSEIVL